jgi:hypothetical protein
MLYRDKKLQFTLAAGVLFLLAGLRDFVAPGFLRINSGFNMDGIDKVIAGLLIITFGLLHRSRWRRIESTKDL